MSEGRFAEADGVDGEGKALFEGRWGHGASAGMRWMRSRSLHCDRDDRVDEGHVSPFDCAPS